MSASLIDRLPHLHVARLKGGFVLHLWDYPAAMAASDSHYPAVCGIKPTANTKFSRARKMNRREGWQAFKLDSSKVANCKHCLDAIAKATGSAA
jgi:hypothetical protein